LILPPPSDQAVIAIENVGLFDEVQAQLANMAIVVR
jgi:hypothetical protein